MDTVNERASENMKSGARNGEGSERARERKPRKAQTSGKKNTSKICQKKPFNNAVKPVEEAYKFGSFFSACLTDSDFDAKPSVLLLGQYSTGKTTFIEHLLGRKYPGANIGPEPSTDRVVAISHALEDRRTPGATLAVNPSLAWSGLAAFGNSFLARFEGAGCHAPSGILRHMTLVDTPGILSGEKQRIARSFDFVEVCSWFAARCDLILLLFDPAKLDVSDEFKEVITALRGHDDKVRVVLNKADSVDMQQLMRVYGALLWSLAKGEWREGKEWVGGWGSERARAREEKEKEEKTKKKCWEKKPQKTRKTKNSSVPLPGGLPSLRRLLQRGQAPPHRRQPHGRAAVQSRGRGPYVGSGECFPVVFVFVLLLLLLPFPFSISGSPSAHAPSSSSFFFPEKIKSLKYAIPARAADRKVNEFVKRVRAAKIHVLILGHLRKALPVVGRAKAQAALLADLPNVFAKVAREHHLPAGDFPDPSRYASILRSFELSSFPKLREKDVKSLEQALTVDVPALVQQFDNPYGAEEDE